MASLSTPTPEEVTVPLTIIPGDDLARGASDAGIPVMVSAEPPPGTLRTPSDICCVVDVSGSMGSEATVATESGSTTGHGLSVLDIVKHALQTIIRTLEDSDRLALVAYSDDATTVFGVTEMNEAGRRSTEQKLAELTPAGMTNLWGGLKVGMDLLKDAAAPGRLQHIMLFTDGLPNINPPRGIIPMVRRLKDKDERKRLPCTVSTFGFGYELDSELLSEIAILGSGTYAFIPDAGFVGTVFVNAVTNLLCTMGKDATLTVLPKNGARLVGNSTLGGHPTEQADGGFKIDLGCLHFGQRKDVLVNLCTPSGIEGEFLEAKLQYGTRIGGAPMESSARLPSTAPDGTAKLQVEVQRCRLRFVDGVREAMKAVKLSRADAAGGKAMPLDLGQAIITAMADEFRTSPAAAGNEFMEALLEDLTGQVSEALSREDWYKKWGVHYLPSLMAAHLAQICNNFKDPGVQQYGGALFEDLRDKADDIFCSLPAPSPTVAAPPPPAAVEITPERAPAYTPPVAAAPVSMATYYDRYAG